MISLKVMGRVRLGLPAIFVLALLCAATEARAQSNQNALASRRGSGQLGAVLRTAVRTDGLFRQTAGRGGGRQSQLGFVNSSQGALQSTIGARREGLGNNVFFQGTVYNNNLQRGSLLRFFGQSPSARFFSPPGFVGRQNVYPSARPMFGVGNADFFIFQSEELSYTSAFHYPAAAGLAQGALRDEETNASLNNIPKVPENIESVASQKLTHTQRLERRIKALRQKQLDGAWVLLREGEYHQSRVAFKRASLGLDEDTTSAIGEFIGAVADRQFNSAVVHLKSMLRHNPKMFSQRYSLEEVLPSARDGEQIISECAVLVNANPDSDSFAAVQAFLLWIDSAEATKQAAAINAATRLKTRFRSSQYAGFIDKMREELEASENASGESNPS